MKASKIIATAKAFENDNSSKFTKAYGVPASTSWCAIFVWYVFRAAGASSLFFDGKKVAYVPTAETWLRAHCERVPFSKARAGDIVIFSWNPPYKSRDHIGLVEKLDGVFLHTIEGNTGSPSAVRKRSRVKQNVYAIYRPKYEKAKAASAKKTYLQTYKGRALPKLNKHADGLYIGLGDRGGNVKQVQRFLNWYIGAKLAVDGIFGRETFLAVKRWQTSQKFRATGKFGDTSLARAKTVKKVNS